MQDCCGNKTTWPSRLLGWTEATGHACGNPAYSGNSRGHLFCQYSEHNCSHCSSSLPLIRSFSRARIPQSRVLQQQQQQHQQHQQHQQQQSCFR
ncbi:hypothetical protein WJX82_005423 [Trebouxia sp. C0006]